MGWSWVRFNTSVVFLLNSADDKLDDKESLCMSVLLLYSTAYLMHIQSPQVGHMTTVPYGNALNPVKYFSPRCSICAILIKADELLKHILDGLFSHQIQLNMM